jgi:acyl-coenzyme A synthetase/AMP-(fatty) acid ligase
VGLLAVHRSDPGLMLGYWNRAEEDAEVFRGDWFVGGDLASMDEDGYIWFQGRADDVMSSMGYRVSPAEVEAALAPHPDIAEVAVTEVPAREGVRIITAFVVPKEGHQVNRDSILAFAAENLAAYKRPREVIAVPSLPRTSNGKVRRSDLKDLAESQNK